MGKNLCALTFLALVVGIITPNIAKAEPLSSSSQRISSTAVATGSNATAISHITQQSHQHHSPKLTQVSIQQAEAHSVATGRNTTAVNSIYQQNYQQGKGNGVNPQAQISGQRAKGNTAAIGEDNQSVGEISQQNSQIYSNW